MGMRLKNMLVVKKTSIINNDFLPYIENRFPDLICYLKSI